MLRKNETILKKCETIFVSRQKMERLFAFYRKIATFSHLVKKWNTFHILSKKFKNFWLLCQKIWNTFRFWSKKVKHIFINQKREPLFAFCWKKYHILEENVKRFSHLVNKTEALFATCKKFEVFFSISWNSKEKTYVSDKFEKIYPIFLVTASLFSFPKFLVVS